MVTAWKLRLVATIALTSGACATMNGAPTPATVDAAIRARTAAVGIRLDA